MKLFDITRAIQKKGRFCDLRESKIEINLERGASAGAMPTGCMAGKVPLSLGIGQWAREGGLGPCPSALHLSGPAQNRAGPQGEAPTAWVPRHAQGDQTGQVHRTFTHILGKQESRSFIHGNP